MKKSIAYLSLLLMIVCSFSSFTATISFAETFTYYAKVNSDNIYFYSQPIDTDENRLFVIPQTYFVKLISYQDDNFYYAQYDNLFGYVRIDDVVAMNGVPTNPYATSEFRVFMPSGLGLYSKPCVESENKITDVPFLCETVKFYGIKQGEQYIPDKSDSWFYCCYQGEKEYYGYLYSVFCEVGLDFARAYRCHLNLGVFKLHSQPIGDHADGCFAGTVVRPERKRKQRAG